MPEPEPGHLRGRPGPEDGPAGVIIDNRTGMPDAHVREAVMAFWTETAGFQFGQASHFSMYPLQRPSMLARAPFRTPKDVVEEIKLARDFVDQDDDVSAAIGQMLAIAFGEGMENFHSDDRTVNLFNRIARDMNLDLALKELYREYLIAGQVNTISLYTRSRLNFTPSGTDTSIQERLNTPLLGVLPSEHIRVLTTDVFGTADLAYDPGYGRLRDWLEDYFDPGTSPARRFHLQGEQPILAALFTERIQVSWQDPDPLIAGQTVYRLNPRMVYRTSMPKGSAGYPRPPLVANFALLEAKRLLNVMDYSLLQGGTNYIVVAKVGTDQHPAQQPEVDNLVDQVQRASHSGVLVGDHRITIDIITPDLKELLNPTKRQLIGRKLAMSILRLSEQVTPEGAGEGIKSEMEISARVVTADRRDIRRHVERYIYDETVARNPTVFTNGAPQLWFPKIVLSGVRDFFDSVVKARDRGDIPRKWAVEVLGFPYEAGVAERKREVQRGDDRVLTPAAVPFSSPANQDGGQGRPPGSSSNNGRNGLAPVDPAQRQRAAAEEVRAYWDEDTQSTVWIGELTSQILDEYPDREVGRVTEIERQAVEASEVYQRGPVAVVPVNIGYECEQVRAFRLADGLSMVVGQRISDGAIIARALCFREPHWDAAGAVDAARRWGFAVDPPPEIISAQPTAGEVIAQALRSLNGDAMRAFGEAIGRAMSAGQQPITIHLAGEGGAKRTLLVKDEHGQIIGTRTEGE